jgi:hypothetical protein
MCCGLHTYSQPARIHSSLCFRYAKLADDPMTIVGERTDYRDRDIINPFK